jgi:hypothetical protein
MRRKVDTDELAIDALSIGPSRKQQQQQQLPVLSMQSKEPKKKGEKSMKKEKELGREGRLDKHLSSSTQLTLSDALSGKF